MGRALILVAVVGQLIRPANPRPIQPVRTSEVLIAVAVIAAIALVMGGGYLLGRMQSGRRARARIRNSHVGKRIDNRNAAATRRANLRLVTRKRR
jgi:flagellar biogenesis protein FliO